jgi:hypothetical protein
MGGRVLLRDGVVAHNVVGSNVLDGGLGGVRGGVGVSDLVWGGGELLARVELGGDLLVLSSLGESARASRGGMVVGVTDEVINGVMLDWGVLSSAKAAVARFSGLGVGLFIVDVFV